MVFSSNIVGFFDHQYFLKETVSVLDFLHRDSYQRQTPSKSTTVVLMWASIHNHAQTRLNSSGSDFGWSECDVATLKIVQNGGLIKFWRPEFFPSIYYLTF